ncbi:Hypothetical predicted protein [Octopus vulgaris]|uniref:Uncharacterized protein n=1 Tax=Octopus vulgaris TaxID=6645 RepID=A0AA36BDE4_OCTVU|nr:Hypothetical predicted protein [Octopus vulgaris]
MISLFLAIFLFTRRTLTIICMAWASLLMSIFPSFVRKILRILRCLFMRFLFCTQLVTCSFSIVLHLLKIVLLYSLQIYLSLVILKFVMKNGLSFLMALLHLALKPIILNFPNRSNNSLTFLLAFLIAMTNLPPSLISFCHQILISVRFVMRLYWQGFDHVAVAVGISLNCSAAKESPIHHALFSYDCGEWDNFLGFLRDVPWTNIFAKPAEACAGEVTTWISAGINIFIPARKYQLKPHSSPWSSPAITHHNHFPHQFQRDNSAVNKQLFTNACNPSWAVIRDAKSHYGQHIHDRISSQKAGSRDFWRIIKSVRGDKKSSIPPLFNRSEVLTTFNDKAELFAQLFSSLYILNDSGHPLPDVFLKTDKLLHSCHMTSK